MMNNYIAEEKRIPVNEGLMRPIPESTAIDTMKSTSEKASIALKMLNKINGALFGGGEAHNAAEQSASCFMEDLKMTEATISQICTGLETLMVRLGM